MLDGMELDEDAVKAEQMLNQVSDAREGKPRRRRELVKRWLNK